jgi:hypothetical protein
MRSGGRSGGGVACDVEFVPDVRGRRSAGSVPSVEQRSVVSTLLEALLLLVTTHGGLL